MTTATPLARYGAIEGALASGLATAQLHHWWGRDRVVGLDLNPGMLAVARAAADSELPIEWVEGSALGLPFPGRLLRCRPLPTRTPVLPGPVASPSRDEAGTGGLRSACPQRLQCHRAHACAHLGAGASNTKRAEHIFAEAEELRTLVSGAGFDQVEIHTVTQQVAFPSVLDYVRFQLTATPMAVLLSERSQFDREAVINAIASDAQSVLLDSYVLADGRLRFPQEGYVAIAVSGG
ncbi:hypothetical protein AB395_00006600 (plasmid) [Sinorhizobium fredii CCBAU 45436]|nr:hypothetical protein AB395_00006600 [Sinorhizobium fredii CCBAU 45436]